VSSDDRPPATKTEPGEPVPEALIRPGAPSPKAPPAAGAGAGADKADDQLPRGTMVDGKYAVDRVLGSGGMGVVYLARDVHTGIEVVLKAIRPTLAHRADIRQRVIAEGRALGQIDHPNVVHLKSVVQDHNGLFLVMPYIDGESLDKTLRRYKSDGKHMPFAEALRLFRMTLAGVAAAHDEGVIHRDLKPANVLLRKKDGVAKVTDFGIAKAEVEARAGGGQTKGVIGSLWYMSPEQVQGRRDLDKRVDIYSLGILFFELCTGHVPFRGESSYDIMKAHVEEPFPSVRAERSDVPAWLDPVLTKACAKDREDRYPTCEAFRVALDEAEAGARLEPPPLTAAPKPTRSTTAVAAQDPADTPGATSPGTSVTGEHGPKRAPRARAAPTIAILGFVLVAGGLGLAYFISGAGQRTRPHLREVSPWATTSGAAVGGTGHPVLQPSAAPSATPVTTPASGEDALAKLAGGWRSENGLDVDAVVSGDRLELRIVDPAQAAPQDYIAGEARFVLSPIPNETATFAVEDKVRPKPPALSKFDSQKARTTCQENYTEASGRPLRATFDGTRLTVELAKIEPTQANFTRGPDKDIVGCVGLRKLTATIVKSTLTRR
jgi:serine/threonine protein kinase